MVPVKTNSNWLPSIFNDFFENEWLAKTGVTAPAINVIENDKDYKVEMAAPGMTKDDFKVNVDENNNLTICMEKKEEKKEEKKDKKYLRREFSYSSSSRPSCYLKTWRRIRFPQKSNTGSCPLKSRK